jgi:hypothetical protein
VARIENAEIRNRRIAEGFYRLSCAGIRQLPRLDHDLKWLVIKGDMGRISELISHLVIGRPWNRSGSNASVRELELERLAHAVLEFGSMKHQVYRNDITTVDVGELAFRLRETRHAIAKTLKLLEERGVAERTHLPGLWKLDVSDLDQQLGRPPTGFREV